MLKLLKNHLDKLSHRFMLYLTIAIILIMGANFIWIINYQQAQALSDLKEKANIIGLQFQAMRAFSAQKQDVINRDSKGNFEFKHLNPAAFGKGVGDIFGTWTDYSIKQTRLNVRNPENTPDAFEIKMIQKLKDNPLLTEVWGREKKDGKIYFRYLIPLKMEKSCLDCHGKPTGAIDIAGYPKEGYEESDFGGVISISMPMDSFYASLYTTSWHYLIMTGLLVAFTLFTTYGMMRVMVGKPLEHLSSATKAMGKGNLNVDITSIEAKGEIKVLAKDFNKMAKELKEMYEHLEQKVAERTKQLKDTNERLVHAHQLQSEFLANTSHELRTPLTSIIAFAELMYEQAMEEGQKEQAENLFDIKQCSYQLLHLINNLLDMAKIEANQMRVKIASTDLAEIVENVEKTIQPLAKRKGITINNLIDWQTPLVLADPDRIRQVLLNLAGNAVKFTPEGGTISFRAKVEKNRVICSVADNGIGIAEEDKKLIFEKFRQVDSSTNRSHAGTGLGLALVKNLIELHGGKIWLDSTLEKGSTFSFDLPLSGQGEEVV